MSDDTWEMLWWVMRDEWWEMSDERWAMRDVWAPAPWWSQVTTTEPGLICHTIEIGLHQASKTYYRCRFYESIFNCRITSKVRLKSCVLIGTQPELDWCTSVVPPDCWASCSPGAPSTRRLQRHAGLAGPPRN